MMPPALPGPRILVGGVDREIDYATRPVDLFRRGIVEVKSGIRQRVGIPAFVAGEFHDRELAWHYCIELEHHIAREIARELARRA